MIGLAILGTVAISVVLAALVLVRVGSGREDRDATLRYGPPSRTAAAARRMTGLYVRMPDPASRGEDGTWR